MGKNKAIFERHNVDGWVLMRDTSWAILGITSVSVPSMESFWDNFSENQCLAPHPPFLRRR